MSHHHGHGGCNEIEVRCTDPKGSEGDAPVDAGGHPIDPEEGGLEGTCSVGKQGWWLSVQHSNIGEAFKGQTPQRLCALTSGKSAWPSSG